MPNSSIKSMLCMNMKELHEKSRGNLLESQDLGEDNEAII